jgi:hypothetical protein
MRSLSSPKGKAAVADDKTDLRGKIPESWHCVDCRVNTAPGCMNRVELERAFAQQDAAGALQVKQGIAQRFNDRSEVYTVRANIWKAAGMEDFGGCLCIGCLEKRLGHELKPKDFKRGHPFNALPGTMRLLRRQGR